ncbi:B3 domain-containing protein At2g33720 [Lycium ferocissimum]|uniref:B3 domain-containing protein At2g33720 n=1 Tax=Lycium ferocissimum TaxID=112874 RepID=UPI0028160E49|nr:B3 domain-containing protein At2g33720 [Lycium ferocissimum]
MKKVFFYNFIPSKVEEESCRNSNIPWLVTRRLVEIRDKYSAPVIDLEDPWQIKKSITYYEAIVGKLVLPFAEVFEHIFRYWTLDMAEFVMSGHKTNVYLWDVTEENNPKKYHNDGTYFEMMPNEDYALVCVDLFKDRGLSVGDEIGLYWDPSWSSHFKFKLICNGHAVL